MQVLCYTNFYFLGLRYEIKRYKAQWSKVAHFDANADGMEASHLVNYAGQLGLTLLTPIIHSSSFILMCPCSNLVSGKSSILSSKQRPMRREMLTNSLWKIHGVGHLASPKNYFFYAQNTCFS